MLDPARLFDYATSESSIPRAFAPPANARIVSFTVAGKTANDQDLLANLSTTKFVTFPAGANSGHATLALGIQRCPLANSSGVDDKASRDPTPAWTARAFGPTGTFANAAALTDSNGRLARAAELYAGSNENPYAYFYQFLSPVVSPTIAPLNRHLGVLYEGADQAFKNSGGTAVRFDWDAPPAMGAAAIATTNPGLALVLVLSTARPAGTAMAGNTNDYLTQAPASDLTVDVTIEVEIDKNNDSQNPQPFVSGAWSASELQNIIE
jgi:hypothetical protein